MCSVTPLLERYCSISHADARRSESPAISAYQSPQPLTFLWSFPEDFLSGLLRHTEHIMLYSGIDACPLKFTQEFCAFDVNLYLSVIMGVISGTLVLPVAIAFWDIFIGLSGPKNWLTAFRFWSPARVAQTSSRRFARETAPIILLWVAFRHLLHDLHFFRSVQSHWECGRRLQRYHAVSRPAM
jgi:hypothetical protein